MVINLLAAHSIRFRVQARGSRLWIGLLVTVVGVGVTWLVIAAGHNKEGLQNEPFFEWSQFYVGCRSSPAPRWPCCSTPSLSSAKTQGRASISRARPAGRDDRLPAGRADLDAPPRTTDAR
jgi:hypothetical protein